MAGTVAALHWWGWELTLNEAATQALLRLLGSDVKGLLAAAAALAPASAVLAAVAAVILAAGEGLDTWVAHGDAAGHNGVVIHGYMWIGVWVAPR